MRRKETTMTTTKHAPGGEKILSRTDERVAVVGQALEDALPGRQLRVLQVFADQPGRVLRVKAPEPIDVGDYVAFRAGDTVVPITRDHAIELLYPKPQFQITPIASGDELRDALQSGKLREDIERAMQKRVGDLGRVVWPGPETLARLRRSKLPEPGPDVEKMHAHTRELAERAMSEGMTAEQLVEETKRADGYGISPLRGPIGELLVTKDLKAENSRIFGVDPSAISDDGIIRRTSESGWPGFLTMEDSADAEAFEKLVADGKIETSVSEGERPGDRWVDYGEAGDFALDSFRALDRAANPFAGEYWMKRAGWSILRKDFIPAPTTPGSFGIEATHTWHGWRERCGRIEILVRQRTDLGRTTHPQCRSLVDEVFVAADRMAEAAQQSEEFIADKVFPSRAAREKKAAAEPRSFRPGLAHEPDPRCDCGGQKGGGRCDEPCPAAMPFEKELGCIEHALALADLGECGGCGAAAYCPGCQRCFDCTEPNDDGAHLTPLCESCEKPADFEIHNEDTDGRTVATYVCEGHVAAGLPRNQQSGIVPIDVDRCTARALKAREEPMPF